MTHSEQPPPFKTSRPTRGDDGKRERGERPARAPLPKQRLARAGAAGGHPSTRSVVAAGPRRFAGRGCDGHPPHARRRGAGGAHASRRGPASGPGPVEPRYHRALHPPERGRRVRDGRPERRRHHADRVRQDALLQHPRAQLDPERPVHRALYLFPTKALAQDQLAELDRLAQAINESAGLDLGVFTYDGDTPQDARRAIRSRAQVILTNPDMLHSGILPHHPKWARLFENLRFIVIDELHAYRGVFGSHLVERPAPTAPRLPALRLGPRLHLFVGHHRQSAGTGRTADRAPVRTRGGKRRAARGEVLLLRQPADCQQAARHPPVLHAGDPPRHARVPAARPAGDRLRAEPPGHRDPHALPERHRPRPAGRRTTW